MRGRVVETARLMVAALVAASMVACSDDADGTGPTPTMDIAPSITALTVAQGASGTVSVTLTRNGGFAGEVSIAVTGTPAGVTATPAPASIAPQSTSSTITIAVGATATPGTSTLTVRATGTGVGEKTVPVTLMVTPAPAGASTTWEFCGGAAPIWFAAQDGDGAWTRITPTGSRFSFDLASARGGVAFVTSTPSGDVIPSEAPQARSRGIAIVPTEGAVYQENLDSSTTRLRRFARNDTLSASVIRGRALRAFAASQGMTSSTSFAVDEFALSVVYGTRTELSEQGRTQCATEIGKKVNGTVANIGARDIADVTLGNSHLAVGGGMPAFQLVDVANGPVDLIASRTARNPTTDEPVVDRMIIRRGLNPANSSTLPVLDFNGADAFALSETNVGVGNIGTAQAFLISFYFTGRAPGAFTGFDGPRPGPFKHRGVPAAKRLPSDLHLASIFAVGSVDTRLAGVYFTEPNDRTITLGDVLPAPTVEAVSTTPYARLRAAGSLPATYDRHVSAAFAQAGRRATIAASAAYRPNATTYDLSIPDFTGVAGWVNDWGTKRGVQTNWSLTAIGFTGAGISAPVPTAGVTLHNASKSGAVTP